MTEHARGRSRADLPTGVVTFLFTDIEGSTRLVQAPGDRFAELLDAHHSILRQAITDHRGVAVSTEGDAFFAAFAAPADAIAAAVQAQQTLAITPWPDGTSVRVRMGMHTGQGLRGGDNYVGLDVHRAARIAGAAHGGQVVVSEQTRALTERAIPVGVRLRDLGSHRLKDLDQPEHLHQLDVEGLPTDFPPLRSLDLRLGNLPRPLTSLVGREREVAEVAGLLDRQRIVTLLGPGGAGKTRLAIEVATQSARSFADGAWFAGLEAVRETALVASAIATALGVGETRDRSAIEALADHVANLRLLLVIDNFEQVLPAAEVVDRLLVAGPGVRVLVTSRAPLHLYGEQQYRVPPLGVPDLEHLPRLAELADHESIRLFVERARMAKPDFALTDDSAPAIAEIVARLDGMPLGIELTAARSNLLTPTQMLRRLEHRLAAPSSELAGLPERQRSLRATIDWSHEQLPAPEQVLFRRLSVFAGGGTVEAIETVANVDGAVGAEVLDPVARLVDNSLLRQVVGSDGEARFAFLETIREFASDRLAESGEGELLKRRHAEFVRDLAVELEPRLMGPTQTSPLDRLAAERGNIRAALRWATEDGDTAIGMQIATAVWRFWQLRSAIREGREWLTALLAKHDPAVDESTRSSALTAAGGLAYWQGDTDAGLAIYEEALAIDRRLGDERRIADGVRNLGFMAVARRDVPTALALFREGLERWERIGDQVQIADARASLGAAEVLSGNVDVARDLVRAALEVMLERGIIPRAADNSMALSFIELRRGDTKAAVAYARQGIELAKRLGDRSRAPIMLDAAYAVALDQGRNQDGVMIAGAAAAIRAALGGSVPAFFVEGDAPLVAARAELGDEDFEAAWAAGQRLEPDVALDAALETLEAIAAARTASN